MDGARCDKVSIRSLKLNRTKLELQSNLRDLLCSEC